MVRYHCVTMSTKVHWRVGEPTPVLEIENLPGRSLPTPATLPAPEVPLPGGRLVFTQLPYSAMRPALNRRRQ